MLVYHIRNLSPSSLANMIYVEQLRNKWPGLVPEAIKICEELGVEPVHMTKMKKERYKKTIKIACFKKDEENLRKQMKSKCADIVNDEFEVQDYMKENSLKTIRDLFRIKIRMNHLKANFPNDPKNKRVGGMSCVGCGSTAETNSHVAVCNTYADLRVGRDLNNDQDLVNFFKDVMARREAMTSNPQL